MTIPEITAAQAEIRRQVSEVDAAIAKLKEPEKPEKWVPRPREMVYVIWGNGVIGPSQYSDHLKDYPIFPHTPEGRRQADRAALRIRSLRHDTPPFKKGQDLFCVYPNSGAVPWQWDNVPMDLNYWHQGRIHATKEEAEAWSKEFSEAWGEE